MNGAGKGSTGKGVRRALVWALMLVCCLSAVSVAYAGVKSISVYYNSGSACHYSKTMDVGAQIQLTVELEVSGLLPSKEVTWSTEEKGIATVTSAGKVTAVAAGKTRIVCTPKEDTTQKAYFTVTVNPKVTAMSPARKVVCTQENNIYSAPYNVAHGSECYTVLKKGAIVAINGKTTNGYGSVFYRTTYNGKTAWIYANTVSLCEWVTLRSVKADAAAYQVGQTAQWTVDYTKGYGDTYFIYRLYKDGQEYAKEGKYASTYAYKLTEPGVYYLEVQAINGADEYTVRVKSASVTVESPVNITGVTVERSQLEVGESTTWFVSMADDRAYVYSYTVYRNGEKVLEHESDTAYLSMKFASEGQYDLYVYAMDEATGAASQTVKADPVTVRAMSALGVTVTEKYTVRETGQPNRYYAAAKGGTAPYTYYFRLYKNGAVYHNSGWISTDNYRIDFTDPGSYTMTVKAQDAKGNKTDWVSCAKTTVARPVSVQVTGKYTEREPGQPNRYYAAAQGGTAPYMYYFRLYKDGTVYHNSGWISTDNYRIDFTEPGSYVMYVKAQDQNGQKSGFVAGGKTVVNASVTVSVTGKYASREVGQPNRYYAEARGGKGGYQYYFRLYKDGAVYHNSGWISADNYRIDFTEPGVYVMTVKAQDKTGAKSEFISCGQPVVSAGAGAPTVTVTCKYPVRTVGQPNRYYAAVKGGTAPYTYYFRLYKDGAVYHNSGWISQDNYRIDFTEPGDYVMTVKVQGQDGVKSVFTSGGKTIVIAP